MMLTNIRPVAWTVRRAAARLAAGFVLIAAGSWAAGLTPGVPVSAFRPAGLAPISQMEPLRAAGPEAAALVSHLKAISAKTGRGLTTVTIEVSDPVAFLTNRPDPTTLVIDLRNVDPTGTANEVKGVSGLVAGVSVEDAVAVDGASIARVRIQLTQPAAHRVRSRRNLIEVDLDPEFPLVTASTSPAASDVPAALVPRATMLESLRVDAQPTGATMTIVGNGELVAGSVTPPADGSQKVVLDFPSVRAATPGDVPIGRGPVERIQVATTGAIPLTRVVVELSRPATYRVLPPEGGSREFKVIFEDIPNDLAPVFVASLGVAVPAGDPLGTLTASSRIAIADALGIPTPGAGAGALARAQQPAVPLPVPPLPAPTGQTVVGQRRTFTGNPVNLDFQGADLRAVLRTFSEISGLNIVIDPSVQGSVDVALREVPWDQALDIILRANKLDYVIEGTIVRIAPLAVLADEEAQRRKLADEQALSGELQVLTRPLSYARAAELTTLLTRTALSSRGDIQVDTRTNTIIIRDLANRLQTVSDLINTLDRPQPQVEIEARIVQTNRAFARNLGVTWGFNGRVAPDLGNTTGLAFPNSGSLSGRTGTGAADNAVALGVSPVTSAIGLALGSVNGALNLDVALSALESSGQGRILSTPRVATQNNVPAEITQGVQIPIQTVANNTITVTFKDAALTLRVTPQITAVNTVIMQIAVENASPDYSKAINNIPPINTQRALTQVLVSDGQTTVIGGIYLSQEQSTDDRTPGLHRIPLLGWLFQRQSVTDESRELLIFITPRIMKM